MVSSVLRRRLLIGAGVVVAVPCLTVVGASGYIYYRSLTKPPDHQFRALVMANGMLDLPDCNIPQPTKWEIFIRIMELVRVFLPVVVYYYLFGYRDEHYDWWLHKLLAAVEAAGPAFVKAGQWSCTRNDLFSPHFRKVFTKLYSEVSIHPFAETRRMIETETGKKVEEIFSSLEEMPVGSGSIGQVHRGVLRENNRQVAVKIMHPRVVEQIARDFFVINLMASWADKHFKSLEHLELPVQAFAWTNHLAAQLDFRIEFEHLKLMRENFAGTDYVRIPEPIQATQRVLIEEFVPGEPATPEFLRSLPAHSRDILAAKGLNCYCKMLLRDNFIHGDMHPGNILIDARDVHHPQAALIDVGLCMKLSHVEGNRSNDLMSAFVKWDGVLCRDTLLAMGRHQKYCDTELFKTEVDDLFHRYRPISGNEEGVVENILQSLFEATRRARVTMDPGYVNLMFSVLVLEGFIMALNPEYNMVKHAAPWLVGDGHLSTTLVKNIFRSGFDHVRVRASEWKARLTGQLPDPDSPYQPKRRPRFDVEQGRAVSHEELAQRQAAATA